MKQLLLRVLFSIIDTGVRINNWYVKTAMRVEFSILNILDKVLGGALYKYDRPRIFSEIAPTHTRLGNVLSIGIMMLVIMSPALLLAGSAIAGIEINKYIENEEAKDVVVRANLNRSCWGEMPYTYFDTVRDENWRQKLTVKAYCKGKSLVVIDPNTAEVIYEILYHKNGTPYGLFYTDINDGHDGFGACDGTAMRSRFKNAKTGSYSWNWYMQPCTDDKTARESVEENGNWFPERMFFSEPL